jgi:hypothetical protein
MAANPSPVPAYTGVPPLVVPTKNAMPDELATAFREAERWTNTAFPPNPAAGDFLGTTTDAHGKVITQWQTVAAAGPMTGDVQIVAGHDITWTGGAHWQATGSADQTTINAAAAAVGTGTVVLVGHFFCSASIALGNASLVGWAGPPVSFYDTPLASPYKPVYTGAVIEFSGGSASGLINASTKTVGVQNLTILGDGTHIIFGTNIPTAMDCLIYPNAVVNWAPANTAIRCSVVHSSNVESSNCQLYIGCMISAAGIAEVNGGTNDALFTQGIISITGGHQCIFSDPLNNVSCTYTKITGASGGAAAIQLGQTGTSPRLYACDTNGATITLVSGTVSGVVVGNRTPAGSITTTGATTPITGGNF